MIRVFRDEPRRPRNRRRDRVQSFTSEEKKTRQRKKQLSQGRWYVATEGDRKRDRESERKEKSQQAESGSRKFLRLMAHNKRLSVPKLIMSVHAGLISFPAFNKYVAQVIRHNFSTRRDLVQRRIPTRAKRPYTRESTRAATARAMYYVDIR